MILIERPFEKLWELIDNGKWMCKKWKEIHLLLAYSLIKVAVLFAKKDLNSFI